MHTHILQGVHLPEECPTCSNLWDTLRQFTYWDNIEEEFDEARRIEQEYGEKDKIKHLTRLAEMILKETWMRDRKPTEVGHPNGY